MLQRMPRIQALPRPGQTIRHQIPDPDRASDNDQDFLRLPSLCGSAPQRTFLLTAYGHAFSGLNEALTAVAGIDFTCPDNFVPVANIKYVDRSIGIHRTQKLISNLWPKILTSKAKLLLLNCVWSSFPECREDILRLAEYKHVILADDVTPSGFEIRPIRAPVHWLLIPNGKNAPGEIRVN